MTTVQLSSTFNTVHKNTSHINEQSVYTQGWPRTCDHTKRHYISLSLFHTLSLFLSFFLSVPVRGRETRALCTKKIFRLESQVGLKKEGTCHEKVQYHQESKLFAKMLSLKIILSNFFLT